MRRCHPQVGRRRGSRELESRPLAPLATQDPIDQLDGLQEGNEEEEVMRISPRSDSPRGRSSYVLRFTVSLCCFKQLHFNSVERYLLVNSWPLTSQTCRTSQRRVSVEPTPVNVPPTSADDERRNWRRCHFLLDWSDSKWDVNCCCWGSWRTIWSMEKHVTCLHHHICWSAGLVMDAGLNFLTGLRF